MIGMVDFVRLVAGVDGYSFLVRADLGGDHDRVVDSFVMLVVAAAGLGVLQEHKHALVKGYQQTVTNNWVTISWCLIHATGLVANLVISRMRIRCDTKGLSEDERRKWNDDLLRLTVLVARPLQM